MTDPHDFGLQHDLVTLSRQLNRRRLLTLLGGAALLPLAGCGGLGSATDGGGCSTAPTETEGPYPGDDSNGKNILTTSGVVRSDIRSSIGGLSGTATGVPLTLTLQVVSSEYECSPLEGYAVYLWHCDQAGQYSMYSLQAQNYLRGVQASDAGGLLTFTTIFPACYDGRWPHLHFEVYPSVASATTYRNKILTSQIALPQEVCEAVYASDGYSQSKTNLSKVSLSSDGIFRDSAQAETLTMGGSLSSGLTGSFVIGTPV